jgi:MarR family transcriptional regulator, transcriptional regulator for hemolysin
MEADPPTLGFLLHDVARLLKKRLEQRSRGTGLTRSQWQILAYLAQNEGINQKRLAELLDIEPITVGRIVDKLETLRLVKRSPHPTDRRRWLLHLMPVARSRLQQAGEYGDATRREALAGVSEHDRQHLLKTLQALKQNLTQACETPPAGQKRANHG